MGTAAAARAVRRLPRRSSRGSAGRWSDHDHPRRPSPRPGVAFGRSWRSRRTSGMSTCRPTRRRPRLAGCASISTTGPASVPGRVEASVSTTSAVAAASSTATPATARPGPEGRGQRHRVVDATERGPGARGSRRARRRRSADLRTRPQPSRPRWPFLGRRDYGIAPGEADDERGDRTAQDHVSACATQARTRCSTSPRVTVPARQRSRRPRRRLRKRRTFDSGSRRRPPGRSSNPRNVAGDDIAATCVFTGCSDSRRRARNEASRPRYASSRAGSSANSAKSST